MRDRDSDPQEWHHLEGDAGICGSDEKGLGSEYACGRGSSVHERRGWVCGPGLVLRPGRKASPRCLLGGNR